MEFFLSVWFSLLFILAGRTQHMRHLVKLYSELTDTPIRTVQRARMVVFFSGLLAYLIVVHDVIKPCTYLICKCSIRFVFVLLIFISRF